MSAHRPRSSGVEPGFRLIRELASNGIDVAVACRVLKVSPPRPHRDTTSTDSSAEARDQPQLTGEDG